MVSCTISYSWFEILLLIVSGVLAGIVNTLAGSGTIFTFGAMLFMGIPVVLANTTNRVGVLFQNLSAIAAYFRYGNYSLKELRIEFLLPTLAGALIGAYLAVDVSDNLLNGIAAGVMFLLLIQILGKSKWNFGFLQGLIITKLRWAVYPVFFVVGLYGGFIQIGIGMLLLTAINWFSGASLKESNFSKLVIILIYTVPATVYFAIEDKIIWIPALLLSVGQIIGAYMAGAFSNLVPNAELWVKRLLIAMIGLTLIKVLLF